MKQPRLMKIFRVFIIIIVSIACLFIFLIPKSSPQLSSFPNVNAKPTQSKQTHTIDNKIRLSNIYGLYIDTNRGCFFYSGDDRLVITFLIQTQLSLTRQFNVKLLVRKDGGVVLERAVNVMANKPYSNRNFIFSMVEVKSEKLCSYPCASYLTAASRLTYQLNVNGHLSAEFRVNMVNMSLKNDEVIKKTARLIKCMWMPDDVVTFEYIIKMIIQARYDSIYLCLFAKDVRLKKLLAKFDLIQKVIKLALILG